MEKDTVIYWIPPQYTPLPPCARCSDAMTEKDAIRIAMRLNDEGCMVAIFDVTERPSLREWTINMTAYYEVCA